MSARISVVIPNYNHASFLQQRIDSVLCQTRPPFEIIILDDCSTDNSVALIEKYAAADIRIRFLSNGVNSGSVFAQWNKGVSLANGDLIWIAESDDVAKKDLLEKLVGPMENDPAIVLSYCESFRMNEAGETTGTWKTSTDEIDGHLFSENFIMKGEEYIERALVHRNSIPNASGVLFKRTAYEKAGGASSGLPHTGDWLMWLKILCYGKVSFCAEPLNYFRYHEGSVIAKATSKERDVDFKDWFGYTLRCELVRFLKKNRFALTTKAHVSNAKYMATDKGRIGLYHLRNRKYFKGWRIVLSSSVYPVVQTGYLKKALSFGKSLTV